MESLINAVAGSSSLPHAGFFLSHWWVLQQLAGGRGMLPGTVRFAPTMMQGADVWVKYSYDKTFK